MLKMESPQHFHNSGSDISPKSPAPSQPPGSDYFSTGCASASRQEPRNFDQEGLLRQVNYGKKSDASAKTDDNNASSSRNNSTSANGGANAGANANTNEGDDGSRRRASTISFADDLPTRRGSGADAFGSTDGTALGKKLSTSPPVSFRGFRNSLSHNNGQTQTGGSQRRNSSPPHDRYV